MPSPHDFREYDDVLPGAADRILTIFECESAHRRRVDLMLIRQETRFRTLGMMSSLVLAGFYVGLIVYILSLGQTIAGVGLSIPGLAALVWRLVKGTAQRRFAVIGERLQ